MHRTKVKVAEDALDANTTIAEANLGSELAGTSLDGRLAALRNQVGDVQARQQLAELKARKAAAGQKTM